jgi:GTP-binding protein
LVDLPGYGYARTSKKERGAFAKIILDYVFKCEKMHFLFVLVDSRLEPQKIDLEFIEMLGEGGVPFALIFTKCDKQSATQTQRAVTAYKKRLSEQWEELPPMLLSSSEKGQGREEILEFVNKILAENAE